MGLEQDAHSQLDGAIRAFRFTVRLISVKAVQSSQQLPSGRIQARAPPEILELLPGRDVPQVAAAGGATAPMLVSDALHKLSHEETPLKGCQADVELHSGLLRLATLLARKPCLQLQLVGPQGQVVAQGAAPLALLLQQPTLQGGAPLFDVSHGKPSAANIRQQKQVAVVRVAVSLEERGPAPRQPPTSTLQPEPANTTAAALAAAAGPATALTQDGLTPAKGGTLKQEGVEGARPPSPFGEASREEEEEEEEEPELLFAPDLIISQVEQFTSALQRQSVAEAEGAWEGSLPEAAEELADEMAAAALGRSSLSRQISVARDRPASGETGDLLRRPSVNRRSSLGRRESFNTRGSGVSPSPPPPAKRRPSFNQASKPGQPSAAQLDAAWDMESWKAEEEARWRSELRERELDRMAQLEGEIRRREAARTAEVAALRSLLAAQQQQIVALQAQVHEQGGSAQGAAAVQQPSSLLTGADAEATVAQAKALLKQRSTLLASPEYDKNSEVVKQIDRQVQELGNMALGAWSTKEQSA